MTDVVAETPMQAMKKMEAEIGPLDSTYYQTSVYDSKVSFDIYQVDDGEDEDTHEELEKSGRHIASIAMNKLRF